MQTNAPTRYSGQPVQTVVQTLPPSTSSPSPSLPPSEPSPPERLSLVLRLQPLPTHTPDVQSGQGVVQGPQGGQVFTRRLVGAEDESQIAVRLQQLVRRRGAEQKLAELLLQIDAQLPAEQRQEWQRWLGEWQQAQGREGRESTRLLLLSTLLCRVMQPALGAHRTQQGHEQCKQLISALWSVLQQFLPRNKKVEDFLSICEEALSQHVRSLQHAARQRITMDQINCRNMYASRFHRATTTACAMGRGVFGNAFRKYGRAGEACCCVDCALFTSNTQ